MAQSIPGKGAEDLNLGRCDWKTANEQKIDPKDFCLWMLLLSLSGCKVSQTVTFQDPASDLLVLESGHLIPMVFVVEAAAGRVVVDPPAGLLD